MDKVAAFVIKSQALEPIPKPTFIAIGLAGVTMLILIFVAIMCAAPVVFLLVLPAADCISACSTSAAVEWPCAAVGVATTSSPNGHYSGQMDH